MLIQKAERLRVNLNSKNTKNYKRTCKEFNGEYNRVLSELLTDKYSLPTRREWDSLMSEINKLRKEIKSLKLKKKTVEEMFQESLKVFKQSKGEQVNNSEEGSTQLELIKKEERLKILLEYKNNLHIPANNSNITITTVYSISRSIQFD